jgi:Tfp pilus assembly protein PilF
VAAARKDNAAAERYYQRTLRMDRGNNLAVRGLANLYRANRRKKPAPTSPACRLPSGAALMISSAA